MENFLVFDETSPSLQNLALADEKMAGLIKRVGAYTLELRTNYFTSLARAVTGQQLSVGAARTIWNRTGEICGSITPYTILAAEDQALRSAGLSRAKVAYLKDLAERTASGALNFEQIVSLSDEEIITILTAVKGVGRWTAEMFLIFSLGRDDILSSGDLGIKRAIMWLYVLKQQPSSKEVAALGRKWKPYRTAASLYLWEAVNRRWVIRTGIA